MGTFVISGAVVGADVLLKVWFYSKIQLLFLELMDVRFFVQELGPDELQ
jgi:hypothetical protein